MTDKKPELKRDSTMQMTTKEGERYLQEVWNVKISAKDDDACDSTKPKLSKHTTMLQTKKEGESYVATKGGGLDDDIKTRNQQDQIDKILNEPSAKKLKVVDEEDDNKQKSSLKRSSTTLRTAKEGQELLKELGHKDDLLESDRRRTRSQTRGVPAPPPTPKRERKPVKDVSKNDVTPKVRGRGRPKKEKKGVQDEKIENCLEDSAKEDQNVKESGEGDKEVHENENGEKQVEDTVEGKTPAMTATSVITEVGDGVKENKN